MTRLTYTPLPMAELIKRIQSRQHFSAIKLCHGFWERMVLLEEGIAPPPGTRLVELPAERLDAGLRQLRRGWGSDLLIELLKALGSVAREGPLMAMLSPFGWAGADRKEGTPLVGLDRVEEIILRHVPTGAPIYSGLFWKDAVQDGTFVEFVSALREQPVVVVGPHYVKSFAACCGWRRSEFVRVHEADAALERLEILDRVAAAIQRHGGRDVITLVEAGEATASWLVIRLARQFPHCFNFVLGQALNLFAPEQLRRTNWFCEYAGNILNTSRRIYPNTDPLWDGAVADSPLAVPFVRTPNSRNGRDRDLERQLMQAIRVEPSDAGPRSGTPIPFVDRKHVDAALVDEILSLSKRENRYANFGPVSALLESAIHRMLNLPAHRAVVMSKSGTSALHALVAVHELNQDRRLRWVTSAFGFFSSAIGPLAEARIIDCNATGLLDIERLAALPEEDWDGVVVTNVFGLATTLDPYVRLCRSRGKVLLLDNATSLFCDARNGDAAFPDEIVSFHHTKPHGIGEGGCLIMDVEHAPAARALSNFGVGLGEGPLVRLHAHNGKISDYDCALILQHLIRLPLWADRYRLQQRRVRKLAQIAGLVPLHPATRPQLLGSLPLLSERPIPSERLENPHVVLRKYYRPLTESAPRAAELYDRIVHVPCHPGVAACSDNAYLDVLRNLHGASN